jgi:hypothetical protein
MLARHAEAGDVACNGTLDPRDKPEGDMEMIWTAPFALQGGWVAHPQGL